MANKKEPPFFNKDNTGSFRYMLPFYTMELFIETLPGIRFHLQVSPFEAVKCVKVRIQRLRGIPVSQQHLMWNNIELEDETSLKDYNISEGCTLKLVFAMRSGPINIRRVPLEDPLREKSEYISPMQDALWEKTPSSKRVILVYQDGDDFKFLRVINDLSTLSDSSSGGSVYNLNTEDEDAAEASLSGQQIVENSITMNKMKLLKSKMESMNLNKKPKKSSKLKPRPPVAPRPSSTLFTSARHKFLKVLPNIGQSCLPPGNLQPLESSHTSHSILTEAAMTKPTITGDYVNNNDGYTASLNSIVLPSRIPKVELENDSHSKNLVLPPVSTFIRKEELTSDDDLSLHKNINFFTSESPLPIGLLNEVGSSEQDREIRLGKVKTEFGVFDGYKDPRTSQSPQNTLSKPLNSELMENGLRNHELNNSRKKFLSPIQISTQMTPNAFPKAQKPNVFGFESLRPTSSHMFHSLEFRNVADNSFSRTRFRGLKVDSPGKRSGVVSKMDIKDFNEAAEETSKESVDALSDLDFFASLARSRDGLQGSRNPDRLHSSANSPTCSLLNPFEGRFKRLSPLKDNAGLFSPHGPRGIMTSTVTENHIVEATHLFPPVNCTIHSKKKVTKHCFVCRKKTGLATSFDCRCGNNFCAAHRYAETHNCPYDYKAAGKRYLQEAYPVVSAPKLPKI